MKQLYRVWWKGKLVGTDIWQNNPEHLNDHLFLSPSGRVFWLSHKGLEDITDDCRVEITATPPTEKQTAFLARNGIAPPPTKEQAAVAIGKLIAP